MPIRRSSTARVGVFDNLHVGSRRFEESLDALTRHSIEESLGQIETALQERYALPPGAAKRSRSRAKPTKE